MIVLDENFPSDQEEILRRWRFAFREIGVKVGWKGVQDTDIIRLLHKLDRPTFSSLDLHFSNPNLCHERYCLVYLDVVRRRAAEFTRRFLQHEDFHTRAKRMGTIIHIQPSQFTYWRIHAAQPRLVKWATSGGRR